MCGLLAKEEDAGDSMEPHRNPNTEEFIVLRQGHIANRSLPVKGQCAFVRAAFGKAAIVTTNERHSVESQRPVGALGYED